MSIYFEPLIIQNLLLTTLISISAYRFLHTKIAPFRVFTAAAIATVFTLFYPLVKMPLWLGILTKVIISILTALVLFIGKIKLLKGIAALLFAVFLYGGATYIMACLKYESAVDALTRPLPVGFWLIVGTSVVCYFLVKRLTVSYHRRHDTASEIYRYRLVIGERVIEGSGFMDTGNRLYDNVSGLPIVLLSAKALAPHLSDAELTELLCGRADKVFTGARKSRVGSIGGKTDLWLFSPSEFEVYSENSEHILYDVMVGLSFSSLSGGESYDAILHPSLMRR